MNVRCWKCGSKNVNVTLINQQSYSVGKGVAGTLLFGAAGAVMGTNGKSEEKKRYVCQACGEVSTSCMSQSMCEHIERELADDSFLLPSLKQSYPNIEWEPVQNKTRDEECTYSGLTVAVDLELLVDVLYEMEKPLHVGEIRKRLAHYMKVDEENISSARLRCLLKEGDLKDKHEILELYVKKVHYYTTFTGGTMYIKEIVSSIEKDEKVNERDIELALSVGNVARESIVQEQYLLHDEARENFFNCFNKLQTHAKYLSAIELMQKDNILAYRQAIQKLNLDSSWKDSNQLIAICHRKIEELEERKKMEEIAFRKRCGICPYCGGTFKGIFVKICSKCERKKDY